MLIGRPGDMQGGSSGKSGLPDLRQGDDFDEFGEGSDPGPMLCLKVGASRRTCKARGTDGGLWRGVRSEDLDDRGAGHDLREDRGPIIRE